jgi:peptidoglycan hydrolase-like protein with peptidoglycan-binding domain
MSMRVLRKIFLRFREKDMRISPRAAFAAVVAFDALAAAGPLAAAPYNPVTQAVQTKLAAAGFDPGPLDGAFGGRTRDALKNYQRQSGLTQSGESDSATLAKLGIGVADKSKAVVDWIAPPTQAEIDKLAAPTNDPKNAYADYRPNAPAAGLSLPGAAILAAMNKSADLFGSRPPGGAGSTEQGYKYMRECLKTNYAPTHWSDITIHYYCQMSKPRACYTYALSGKSTPPGVKYPRTDAYKGCAGGRLAEAADFAYVATTQPLVFQYVMFGQTHAFDHEQEQAIVNAFYGVQNPSDRRECAARRPRRTEDPTDGTHCLVDKAMSTRLVGKGD